MKISFIITSLNNKNEQLQSCISAIEGAYGYKKNYDLEILVVFQGLDKNSHELIIRYPELTSFFYIEKRGLSYARNYAIKESRGDFLVFLDDDARVKEDFLAELTQNLSQIPAEAFCGRILTADTNQCFNSCFQNMKMMRLRKIDYRYFMGSAHILKRTIFDKIGFYDESFGAGGKFFGAEESDMFFRIHRRNLAIAYIPTLIFYHPAGYVNTPQKVFNYSYAVGAMLTKQVISDRKYCLIYLFLMLELICKSIARTLQSFFLKQGLLRGNQHYRYKNVFTGLLCGISSYTIYAFGTGKNKDKNE